MSHSVDITLVVGQVVYSFDPRTPARDLPSHEDTTHVRRCESSARFARGASARDEYDSWRAGLRQQGRS